MEGHLMSNLFIHTYYIHRIWFCWVLWGINHCWSFNGKSFVYIHIIYIGFGLIGFYGISTSEGHLMSNPFHTYIYRIWFGCVLWGFNHCRLFNVKSFLYRHIAYIGFGLVGFYGVSIIKGYLVSNPFYSNILHIQDLVWLGYQPLLVIQWEILFIHTYYIYRIWFHCVLWDINHCKSFKVKSFLYIYITYVISKHIFNITFLNKPELIFDTLLNGFS